VEVAPAGTALETPWVLSSGTPYISLKNGASGEVSVDLDGPGKTEADMAAIAWEYTGSALSLAANGGNAQVTATGSGSSRETVTVRHPRAAPPLSIAVLRYDTEEQREAAKLIYTDTPYHTLRTGETAYLAVHAVNLGGSDTLQWNVKSGSNTVIAFEQLDKSNARISAAAPGTAEVEATFAGTGEKVTFSINVLKDGVVNADAPCYLTTSQNVVTLKAGGEDTVSVYEPR
jgi:hypothetical protein